MTVPPLPITPNPDGTVSVGGKTLEPDQVSALVALLLGASTHAARLSGREDEARQARQGRNLKAPPPTAVAVANLKANNTSMLTVSYGLARLGIPLPPKGLRELGEYLIAASAGTETRN